MLLQLGVASPNIFCLYIMFPFSLTSSANPLGLYELFESVCKMLCSTQHASVIFVVLLGCKYMREDKTRNQYVKIPKAFSVVRHALDNL